MSNIYIISAWIFRNENVKFHSEPTANNNLEEVVRLLIEDYEGESRKQVVIWCENSSVVRLVAWGRLLASDVMT